MALAVDVFLRVGCGLSIGVARCASAGAEGAEDATGADGRGYAAAVAHECRASCNEERAADSRLVSSVSESASARSDSRRLEM
jgi:hypothetical protein